MFYRITLSVVSTEMDVIDDIKDKALESRDRWATINPDQPNEEQSYVSVEQCYHDEEPTRPCDLLYLSSAP